MAWSRINPSLKALATEEYGKRETSLFRPGFLEKASKRLEAEKTLSKVSSQGNKGGPPSKKARYENDKSDLRSVLARGLLQCTAAGDFNADSRTARTQDFRAPDTTLVDHRSHKVTQPPRQKGSFLNNSPRSSMHSIQISEFNPPLNPWVGLTPTHRSPTPLLVKLEQNHIRSMDLAGGKGVSTRASGLPIPRLDSEPTLLDQDEFCIDHGRSGEVDQEAGHFNSHPSSRSVSESHIHSFQEGRFTASGGEPETSESFHHEMPLQDGRGWHVEGAAAEERSVGVYKPERRLSFYFDSREGQEVPTLSVGGANIRVSVPFGLSSTPRVFTKLLKPVMALLRRQGIRTIIFLDDMLIMGQSKEELVDQVGEILQFLQLLGFVINQEKSVLSLSHTIQFLGFIVDSALMMIALPQKKVEDVAKACQAALLQGTLSVRDLSRLIGQMSATMWAVLPAPLCYRNLQRIKNQSLSRSHSFEAIVTLDNSAKEELLWWVHQLATWNGRTILSETPDLVVESDASLLGWSAVSGGVHTGGLWSKKERTQHINYLELMAGALAVRTFAKHKRNIHVRLRMDNQTAIFYVNRMGGTRAQSLVQPACQLWQWCL